MLIHIDSFFKLEEIYIGVLNKLSNEEMKIIQIMWDIDRKVTPTELITFFEERYGKRWAKQTMNTLLKRMLKKGVLSVSSEGRNRYYMAISKSEYEEKNAKDILDNMYNGSIKNFLAALYHDRNKISKKDIEELKDWFSNE